MLSPLAQRYRSSCDFPPSLLRAMLSRYSRKYRCTTEFAAQAACTHQQDTQFSQIHKTIGERDDFDV